jgi:hypothetical protein
MRRMRQISGRGALPGGGTRGRAIFDGGHGHAPGTSQRGSYNSDFESLVKLLARRRPIPAEVRDELLPH